jgi:hypothetical protein
MKRPYNVIKGAKLALEENNIAGCVTKVCKRKKE